MRYAGEQIENLTVTKIAFWNAGNDTIKGQDIDKNKPLTVHIDIDFDYFDKNQGGIIQLFHNGKSGNDIKIYGYIISSGAPIYKKYVRTVLGSMSLIFAGLWLGFPVFLFVISIADGSIFENIKAIASFLIMSLIMVYLILKDKLPKGFEKFQDEILK